VKFFFVLFLVALCLALAWSWATVKAYQPVEQWRPIARLLQKEWRPGNPVICYPDYILGPLGYYFIALPLEAVAKMYPGRDPKAAQATLKTLASQEPGWGEPPQVFLVINLYPHLIKDRGNWWKLLDIVAAEAPRPATLTVVMTFDALITMHPGLVQARENILEDLAKAFGSPTIFHKQGTIYHLRYQIKTGLQGLKGHDAFY
jgi:hypothetical protein